MGKKSKKDELGDHIKPRTRQFLVNFKGSLNQLACDKSCRRWEVLNPIEVYGMEQSFEDAEETDHDDDADDADDKDEIGAAKMIKSLENGLLISATLRKIQSTFPMEVALNLDFGKTAKTYSFADGQKAHYLAFPNETNHQLNEVVVSPDYKSLNSKYLKNHSEYTPNRLKQDVSSVPGKDYSFVHKDNPVIAFVKKSADVLQMRLTDNDMVKNEFYILPNTVLNSVVDIISNELHSKLPLVDLTRFGVEISRPGGLAFDDPAGIADNLTSAEAISKTMGLKRSLNCVLEVTFATL